MILPGDFLQFEREARYMSELSNLVETLERIGIPKSWSMKRYLTNVAWAEVDKYKTDEKIDKELGTDGGEEGGGGFGGGAF